MSQRSMMLARIIHAFSSRRDASAVLTRLYARGPRSHSPALCRAVRGRVTQSARLIAALQQTTREFFGLATCLLCLIASGAGEEVVDRVAAVVNEDVITLSDLHWTIGYKRIPIPEQPEPRSQLLRDTLEQLIEQRLIAEDAAATPGVSVSQEEINNRLEAYQNQFENEAAFEAHLRKIGMSHNNLKDLIERQLMILKFVKLRFEPFVVVLPDQIEAFYQDEFLPKLGVPEEMAPPLEQVQEEIREILKVEITTEDVDDWMTNARRRSSIRVLLFEDEKQSASKSASEP